MEKICRLTNEIFDKLCETDNKIDYLENILDMDLTNYKIGDTSIVLDVEEKAHILDVYRNKTNDNKYIYYLIVNKLNDELYFAYSFYPI